MPVQKIVSKSEESLKPTQKITNVFDEKIQFAIQDLLDTLAAEQARLDELYPGKGKGVGLASNQIEYPVERYGENFQIPNIYVLSIREPRAAEEGCEFVPPSVFINTTMTPLSEITYRSEGCLSIMGFTGFNVPRYSTIKINALNENGEPIEDIVSGFIAHVHQHEIDHGEGSEYLNHIPFSLNELQAILDWLNRQASGAAVESPWVIEGKLHCSGVPDLHAMTVWANHAFFSKHALSSS